MGHDLRWPWYVSTNHITFLTHNNAYECSFQTTSDGFDFHGHYPSSVYNTCLFAQSNDWIASRLVLVYPGRSVFAPSQLYPLDKISHMNVEGP